jgi:SNF2 family DNA or RNA helicase
MLVDLWWNSAKSEQAIGRVFRPGQKAPKVCVYIFVSNTYVEKEIIKKNHVKANILSQLKTGSSSLSIPKINMQSLCKLISLEETKAAMSDYRQ